MKKNNDLVDLHDEVIKHLNNIGFDLHEETYIPHITLMRNIEIHSEDLQKLKLTSLQIKVDSFSVMESKKVEGKLVYEEIKRIEFKK